jgi:hypothetical protein
LNPVKTLAITIISQRLDLHIRIIQIRFSSVEKMNLATVQDGHFSTLGRFDRFNCR